MRTYRAAIVGTGDIAGEHAAAVRGLGARGVLVAVADVDTRRGAAFAEEWGVPAIYPSLTRLLESEAVDLVHICTPPATHAALALECLHAGVVPVVEKPPALSLEQIDVLLAAERRAGVPVVVVLQHRFGPGAQRLRDLGAASPAGRPLVAVCNTLWYRDAEYFSVPWRGRWATEGGGPTMGHGIHQFDLLVSILGDWDEVTALAGRQSRPTETEDVSAAVVRFANGAIATVLNSLVSPRETSQLRIDYEHATVELEHLYGYTDADWRITERVPGALGEGWHEASPSDATSHAMQLRAVIAALDRDERPAVSLTDARRTLELAAAIYASAFSSRPVQAGEIGPGDPFYTAMHGSGAPWAEGARPAADR
jgi:predicted dehydrogenase